MRAEIVGNWFHLIYFTAQLVANNNLDVKENESERCELYCGIIVFMLAALGIIGFLDSWVDVIPNFSCHGNNKKKNDGALNKVGVCQLDHPWLYNPP